MGTVECGALLAEIARIKEIGMETHSPAFFLTDPVNSTGESDNIKFPLLSNDLKVP